MPLGRSIGRVASYNLNVLLREPDELERARAAFGGFVAIGRGVLWILARGAEPNERARLLERSGSPLLRFTLSA